MKQPKTKASMRSVAVDAGTIEVLRSLRQDTERLAASCETELFGDGFVFSVEPDGMAVPHPDAFSSNFRKLCDKAVVASDVHLHSLRHFQTTELDSVVSEAQKQARMGWSTIHMSRHYTDSVSSEDRRAADQIGALLDQAR
ncbi:MAG: hypothetical protein ACRDZ8_08470 [Acidimicrobiales bacterium]